MAITAPVRRLDALHLASLEFLRSQGQEVTGRVEDQTMTLTVTLTETGESIGSFTPTHGRAPVLRKCL